MTGSNLGYGQFSIGTGAATLIVAARTTGKGVRVRNTHATQVLYVGDANVTAANGYPIPAGLSELFSTYTGALYGVGSGAATTGGWIGTF